MCACLIANCMCMQVTVATYCDSTGLQFYLGMIVNAELFSNKMQLYAKVCPHLILPNDDC